MFYNAAVGQLVESTVLNTVKVWVQIPRAAPNLECIQQI